MNLFGEGRWGDGANSAHMIGEIADIRGYGPGAGGNCNGIQLRAGEPGNYKFSRILQMNDDEITRPHALFEKRTCDGVDILAQLTLGPRPSVSVKRLPEQERLVRRTLGSLA